MKQQDQLADVRIGVIGLGYVGLPLAVAFGKHYPVIGFDILNSRISELEAGQDHTLEVSSEELKSATLLRYSSNSEALRTCNFFIVTVPTPVDRHNQPDMTPLVKASQTVGSVLKKGDIVVYESTVYPGATEEVCVPVLERASGLVFNKDFSCGYSPERINPGDKEHTVTRITKVTSGSTPESAEQIDQVYKSVITAGTYKAPSIRVAEAAKVIENSQRDINIAFVNELAKIFSLLGIDTLEVLKAAGTKWNFLKFTPGLVGGHCIGVDPYYLAQKAIEVGYQPEIILAGRRMNNSMGSFVASETMKLMIRKGVNVLNARVLILGFTFKENCPDVRNTRVIDIVHALREYNQEVAVFDPWADKQMVKHEYGIDIKNEQSELANERYDAVIFAVAHSSFSSMDINTYLNENAVVYDLKGVLPATLSDKRL